MLRQRYKIRKVIGSLKEITYILIVLGIPPDQQRLIFAGNYRNLFVVINAKFYDLKS